MVINLTDGNFEQEVLKEDLPVLVDFWAPWCGPCVGFAPVVENIAQEYSGKFKVCKLNVDEASEKASSYEIMSIPTLIIFKSGKIKEKTIGALSKSELEALIRKYI